jgi:hypothetical protein
MLLLLGGKVHWRVGLALALALQVCVLGYFACLSWVFVFVTLYLVSWS